MKIGKHRSPKTFGSQLIDLEQWTSIEPFGVLLNPLHVAVVQCSEGLDGGDDVTRHEYVIIAV